MNVYVFLNLALPQTGLLAANSVSFNALLGRTSKRHRRSIIPWVLTEPWVDIRTM
jgi:hypothetical protein